MGPDPACAPSLDADADLCRDRAGTAGAEPGELRVRQHVRSTFGHPRADASAHTVLARGRVPLPPVSVWPRGSDGPTVTPELPGRPQLPAPSPQSFGYPGDVPTPWVRRKVEFDVVPETTGAANDFRRLLESLPAEDGPAGSPPAPTLLSPQLPLPQLRGPVTTSDMPRGAFP